MSNDFGSFPGDASRGPGYGSPQQSYGQQSHQNGPSHGYAPPGYGAPQGPPPPTGKIKPSIGWIIGAWLLALVSIIVGIVGFVGGVQGAVGGLLDVVTSAAPTKTFAPGENVTVALDPADKPAIYLATNGPTSFECTLTGGTGTPSLRKPPVPQSVPGSDGTLWEMGLQIGVEQVGDYQVTCTADPAEGTTFGVGQELTAESLVGKAAEVNTLSADQQLAAESLARGVAYIFGVPSIGILLAIIVTIVVLVKRSNARKRLAAASAGQWGAPGPYGR
ncbi:hypothetical protein ACIBF6_06380 [Streptosporangium amethystogenes]|uniref:hypothetical protein n=1 Tax=Streptosporangium amethystogenes TaxID=2002 RepID=UPI0037A683A4